MTRARAFKQVDVFTTQPLRGNPVAVVLDADGLSAERMQQMAAWTNLSETTFVGPPTHPDADYSVRIFTTGMELPFAGHPTLGTCHAWLEAGGVPKAEMVVQECGIGLISIRRDGGRLAFAAPERRRSGPLDEASVDVLAHALGIDRAAVVDHQWCDNGPPWEALLLDSAERVLSIQLSSLVDPASVAGRCIGVVGPTASGDDAQFDEDAQFEVRALFPTGAGLVEDPVTGSLNAALAQWLIGAGYAPDSYVTSQGTALGRAGRVMVERIGDTIWVGGTCLTVLDGTATF